MRDRGWERQWEKSGLKVTQTDRNNTEVDRDIVKMGSSITDTKTRSVGKTCFWQVWWKALSGSLYLSFTNSHMYTQPPILSGTGSTFHKNPTHCYSQPVRCADFTLNVWYAWLSPRLQNFVDNQCCFLIILISILWMANQKPTTRQFSKRHTFIPPSWTNAICSCFIPQMVTKWTRRKLTRLWYEQRIILLPAHAALWFAPSSG